MDQTEKTTIAVNEPEITKAATALLEALEAEIPGFDKTDETGELADMNRAVTALIALARTMALGFTPLLRGGQPAMDILLQVVGSELMAAHLNTGGRGLFNIVKVDAEGRADG